MEIIQINEEKTQFERTREKQLLHMHQRQTIEMEAFCSNGSITNGDHHQRMGTEVVQQQSNCSVNSSQQQMEHRQQSVSSDSNMSQSSNSNLERKFANNHNNNCALIEGNGVLQEAQKCTFTNL